MKSAVARRMYTVVLFLIASVAASHGQYSALYEFGKTADPKLPTQGVIAQGRDGSLYSTTYRGGANGAGAIFKITPSGKLTTLYSFCSKTNCSDGGYPYGGLTLGTDGNFYGTALGGGNQLKGCISDDGCGTIFKITPSGTYAVLYSFNDGMDGAGPAAPPVEGDDGNFYGTTTFGGASQCGTIYKITRFGKFTSLYQFDDAHGCAPYGPLVLGADGNFYGTAFIGGPSKTAIYPGFGTIFKVTPSGDLIVLYNFDAAHGAYSYSPMIQGKDKNFYGTTSSGGFGGCNGVIFDIARSGDLIELFCLNGTTDGGNIVAGLVQASDGNFYGVAEAGGSGTGCTGSCGTLFKVTPDGDYSVPHNFEASTGYSPGMTLIQHTNGKFYGMTEFGGITITGVCDLGCGVFYRWDGGLRAFVTMMPYFGKAGSTIGVLGQGFTSSTTVSFNGVAATPTIVSSTYLTVKVPAGAKTGYVKVTTSSGTLTSNQEFRVP